jgi:hypothetical protein
VRVPSNILCIADQLYDSLKSVWKAALRECGCFAEVGMRNPQDTAYPLQISNQLNNPKVV